MARQDNLPTGNKCTHKELEEFEKKYYRCKKCKEIIFELGEFERILNDEDWNKNVDMILMHRLIRSFDDDLQIIKEDVSNIFKILTRQIPNK